MGSIDDVMKELRLRQRLDEEKINEASVKPDDDEDEDEDPESYLPDNCYEYKGHIISDEEGVWLVDGDETLDFDTDKEAEEYIDELNEPAEDKKDTDLPKEGHIYWDRRHVNAYYVVAVYPKDDKVSYWNTDNTRFQTSIGSFMSRVVPSTNEDDYDLFEEEDDEDHMQKKGTYNVLCLTSAGEVKDIKKFTEPSKAVKQWFIYNKKEPTMASIIAWKEDGQKLLDWASENTDKLEEWDAQYDSPYNLEYLIDRCSKPVSGSNKYPDAIDPFSLG